MKTTKNYGTFGYTDIESNNNFCLSNEYQNWNELKRELQGKPISITTIEVAMRKVKFVKYGMQSAAVFSFFPEEGKCFVSKDWGKKADVLISWDVENQKYISLKQDIQELKDLVKKLLKQRG